MRAAIVVLLASAWAAGTLGTASLCAGGNDALLLPSPRVVYTSTVKGRDMVQYQHDSVPGWGYTQRQSDLFWLAKPLTIAAAPPLIVALHSAGGTGTEPFAPICEAHHARGFYGDESFYVLCLDCTQNRNDFWWGAEEIQRNPETYAHALSPTEMRVLATIEWVVQTCGIDRNRIYLNGISMGGSGTLGIGMNHGDLFAATSVVVPAGVEHLKTRMAKGNLPDPPPLVNVSSHLDGYAAGQEEVLKICAERKYSLVFAWEPFGHAATSIGVINQAVYEYPWLAIRKNEAYPVFTQASTDNRYPGFDNQEAPDQRGQINAYFRWKNLEDSPAGFAMELRLVTQEELRNAAEVPREAVAHITLRRVQAFAINTGGTYRWSLTRGGDVVREGVAKPDEEGLLTLPAVKITDVPARVRLTVE